MNKFLNDFFEAKRNFYIEKSCEQVGKWISNYERHPDTGCILADSGYYENEDEIEEYAKGLFLEDLENENLKDDFLNFVDNNYDKVINFLTK